MYGDHCISVCKIHKICSYDYATYICAYVGTWAKSTKINDFHDMYLAYIQSLLRNYIIPNISPFQQLAFEYNNELFHVVNCQI